MNKKCCYMEFGNWNGLLTSAEINSFDLVTILALVGYPPRKMQGRNYWYLSPFGKETSPSLIAHLNLYRWFDQLTDEGSTVLDFVIRYYHCNTKELLIKLAQVFFGPENVSHFGYADQGIGENKILVKGIKKNTSAQLIHDLQGRYIPLDVAQKVCKGVAYEVSGMSHYELCFGTDSGGYELRIRNFRGTSLPNASTFINYGPKEISVFEDFFDFLSCHAIFNGQRRPANFLVLNSPSFLEVSFLVTEFRNKVHLFLHWHKKGTAFTNQALFRSTV